MQWHEPPLLNLDSGNANFFLKELLVFEVSCSTSPATDTATSLPRKPLRATPPDSGPAPNGAYGNHHLAIESSTQGVNKQLIMVVGH